MKLSTKGRYAVTAMMDIAIHEKIGPVALADISVCQGISLSYLEQIFARLRKARLVEGVRGPGGGYRLAKPADKISVAEIIAAMDDTLVKGRRGEQESCLTDDLWQELSKRLYDFLKDISLSEFTSRPEVQEIAERQDKELHRFGPLTMRRVASA